MPSLAPVPGILREIHKVIFSPIKRLKLIGSWFLERSQKLITTSKNIFTEIHTSWPML